METKGVTCKIPLELHNQISEEIREKESTMSKFIEMVIREHYEKGANKVMEKGRTFLSMWQQCCAPAAFLFRLLPPAAIRWGW